MKLGATATKCSPFVQNLMAAALKKIAREKKLVLLRGLRWPSRLLTDSTSKSRTPWEKKKE